MADPGAGTPGRTTSGTGTSDGGRDTGSGTAPSGGTPALALWSKVLVSVVALGALVFLVLADAGSGVVLVVLVVLAVLPWLSAVLETVDVPGVGNFRFRQVEREVADQGRRVRAQEQQLQEQQELITQLVVYSMAWYLFQLLADLHHRTQEQGEYLFRGSEATRRDLRFLRDHGYLEHFVIGDLADGQDLVRTVRLTPLGRILVEMREARREHGAGTAPGG
jgi:hypothetical protein